MRYSNIVKGKFIERPNRFVAMVEVNGAVEVCHVKNTGRCRELLMPGAEVFLEKSSNPNRKTAYDLVGVKKADIMVNMDSQAPNKVVLEWLKAEKYFQNISLIKPECKYGNSRIDFYVETEEDGHKRKIFIEVKGVTLEEEGTARFPDAPTERGVRHMLELLKAVEEGYESYLLFVIQMKPILQFEPNDRTHKAFGETLRMVNQKGVHVLAYDCLVTEKTMELDDPIFVNLGISHQTDS